jgi:hypothetical protein
MESSGEPWVKHEKKTLLLDHLGAMESPKSYGELWRAMESYG